MCRACSLSTVASTPGRWDMTNTVQHALELQTMYIEEPHTEGGTQPSYIGVS